MLFGQDGLSSHQTELDPARGDVLRRLERWSSSGAYHLLNKLSIGKSGTQTQEAHWLQVLINSAGETAQQYRHSCDVSMNVVLETEMANGATPED
jgi:hypothetical protein